MLAPIALFVYKRPEHTGRVLEGLKNNREARESDLFVFSDGAKNSLVNEDVSAVRALLRGSQGFVPSPSSNSLLTWGWLVQS